MHTILGLAAPLVLTAVALALPAGAQTTWHVDASNPNPPGNGTPGNPYTSVQHAIAQPTTLPGDVVLVHPGTYVERIDFLGKRLAVRSSGGPEVTVLDGSGPGAGSVVTAASGEPSGTTLRGFTVRGGSGTLDAQHNVARGGGIFCAQGFLTLQDCRIEQNATRVPGGGVAGSGGGLYARAAQVNAFQCEFVGNDATEGGGAWFEQATAIVLLCGFLDNGALASGTSAGRGGAFGAVDSTLNFDLNHVQSNFAEALPGVEAMGGGLYVSGGGGVVLNSTFDSNAAGELTTTGAAGRGGGIAAFAQAPGDLEVHACELLANSALAGGGFHGTARLRSCQIERNSGVRGAGVHALDALIEQCQIFGNQPFDPQSPVQGLGVHVPAGGTALVTQSEIHGHSGIGEGIGAWGGEYAHCEIRDNRAVGDHPSRGAGAFGATLRSCEVHHNEARRTSPGATATGGGIDACQAERTLLHHNLAGAGGGAHASDLVHCVVADNETTGGASGGGMLGGSATNSILWSNTPGDADASAAITWSDVGTGHPGTGNLAADPDFWIQAAGDFHLRAGSPCIDAGDPASPPDPDGSLADIGAFPFDPGYFALPFVYCTAQTNSQGCTPSIGTSGFPSLGFGQFFVVADEVINQQPGLLFWGSAPAATPFGGGFLCVSPPVQRTPVQSSGGSPAGAGIDCSGSYAFQWTFAYTSSFGIQPGQRVFAQYWTRDPGSPTVRALTDAVDFTFSP